MTDFQRLAPRLYQAHKERKHEIFIWDRQVIRYQTKKLELERLIAHRELQLVRAQYRNSYRYIAVREKKLDDARRQMQKLVDEHVALRNLGGF